ncbi:recombinase family protein [Paenibacillus xanthanilyticus]|uniref:Recombinase family protein n=1 Tax=Paenibacillus xanthanilyticus TaxID=1783531 RepID=A0ABV8KAA0_9BACL
MKTTTKKEAIVPFNALTFRVGIYIRVSTLEQVEGYSLDVQKDRLIAFCKAQGWEEPEIFMDDGYTGTNMNRPALKRMIRQIEDGRINAVIVHKLDRLGRKQKDVMHLLEDVFERHSVVFKSATEPFDTSTSFGKAMIGVLSVFAQLERDMIVERTTNGRREKVKQGKWPGGRVPFGYSWDKEKEMLIIKPEEASIIREIYKRYLRGESRLSISEWASERTKARKIDHSTIREMLNRPVYNGKLILPGDVIVDGNHDAIIDDELWRMVQNEIVRRQDGQTPLGEFLLTGLLSCGVCGGNVVHVKRTTTPNGKTYSYELYACKNQHIRKKDRIIDTCTLGYHRREKVEEYVVREMMDVALKPKKIKSILERQREQVPDHELEKTLRTKMDSVIAGIENLYDAIQSGAIKASALGNRLSRLEEERESIQLQLDELGDSTPKRKSDKEVHEAIKAVSQGWPYLNEDERKAVIRTIITNVTLLPDGNHVITWAES